MEDLAARGIVLADDRWVRYAAERRCQRRLPVVTGRRPRLTRVDPDDVRLQLRVHVASSSRLPIDVLLDPSVAAPTPVDPEVLGAAGLRATLVVPDETLARLLRAHDLQLETGAAVLALPGRQLPAWLLAGIARAGDAARVLVLHDADVTALAGLHGMGERLGLLPTTRITPVGLRPDQAVRLRLPVERRGVPTPGEVYSAVRAAGLSPAEGAWLARGYRADVAAVAPDRLLRALRRMLLGHSPPAPTRRFPSRRAGFM